MSRLSVIAKLTAKEGMRTDLAAALQPLIEHVEANEPDTLKYILSEDTTDENVLWFYEEYANEAALTAHSTSDAMKELGAATREFAAARPEIMVCRTLGGKGL